MYCAGVIGGALAIGTALAAALVVTLTLGIGLETSWTAVELALEVDPSIALARHAVKTATNTIRFKCYIRRLMELLEALRLFGRDAASFQAIEPGTSIFRDERGLVAYRETSSAWVAVGSPLCAEADVPAVAERFAAAAAREEKRAVFFACDDASAFGDAESTVVGEQPWWRAGDWPEVLKKNRRLREQLRRARKKGVVVRRIDASELAEGTPLRKRADDLAAAWLASRPMQPMQFLLTLAMFEHPNEHRYYGAFRGDELVELASLVPIHGRRGWLVEDVVRDSRAPNGTTELVFDCAMRESHADALVTWGLAPLSGAPWPMRAIGALARGLYDFRGLRAFKARLHPREWQKVHMIAPRGTPAWLSVIDTLRAFAGGSLVTFGARTLVRRPLVLAWVLTLLLVPWTTMLVVLLFFHRAVPLLGFPRTELFGWAVFDALFALALLRAFWKPRFSAYAILGSAAAVDALVSTMHIAHAGLGASAMSACARTASAVAPALASMGLLRCARATIVSKEL